MLTKFVKIVYFCYLNKHEIGNEVYFSRHNHFVESMLNMFAVDIYHYLLMINLIKTSARLTE